MKKNIYSILAVDEKLGFGKDNSLPWKLSGDMAFFKELTSSTNDKEKMNAVIMGRKTWESIPKKFRPLPFRLNCILTRQKKISNSDSILYFSSLEDSLETLNKINKVENIFIIGGANLYNSILNNTALKNIFLTRVEGNFNCDVFFDGIPDDFELLKKTGIFEENGIKFSFENWKRKNNY